MASGLVSGGPVTSKIPILRSSPASPRGRRQSQRSGTEMLKTETTTHVFSPLQESRKESIESKYASHLDQSAYDAGDGECEVIHFHTDTENEMNAEEWSQNGGFPSHDLNRNLITGSKKTKTIFSIEVPLTQVETGPGEHGDGRGVHSPQTRSKMVSLTSMNPDESEELKFAPQVFPKQVLSSYSAQESNEDFTSHLCNSNVGKDQKVMTGKRVMGVTENWNYTAATKSSSFSSNDSSLRRGAVGNSMTKTKPFEGMFKQGMQCKALVSKNLVLQRDSENMKGVFRNVFPIHNPTTSLYAFKVCYRDCFDCNFIVSPHIGLLEPGSSINVEISAKNFENNKINKMTVNDQIEINIFPASCADNDPKVLSKYYQSLSVKCPTLIHKQKVERIILWDSGNLNSNLNALNYIQDEQEQTFLKQELHSFQNQDKTESHLDKSESNTTLLRSVKDQFVIANCHIKETFEEMINFQRTQTATLFLCGIIFMSFMLLGGLKEVEKLPAAASEEMPIYERILKGFYLK